MARFGDNLRALRGDLKQHEFAARLGYSASHINKMEGFEFAPKPATVEALADKLAAALGLEPEAVLGRLMQGVKTKAEVMLAKRRPSDLDVAAEEWREIIATTDPDHRPALIESLIRHAREQAAHISPRKRTLR